MNVYVESNFVLEHALEQEQCESCEELIRLASAGSIRLLVPAFSLAELCARGHGRRGQRGGWLRQARATARGSGLVGRGGSVLRSLGGCGR